MLQVPYLIEYKLFKQNNSILQLRRKKGYKGGSG